MRHLPLDYGREPRMCVGVAQDGRSGMAQGGMDITAWLEALSRRLVDAAAIAQAAITCARSGAEREAVRISMPLDGLLGDAQTLHGAVCLISRMQREERLDPN